MTGLRGMKVEVCVCMEGGRREDGGMNEVKFNECYPPRHSALIHLAFLNITSQWCCLCFTYYPCSIC